MIYITKKDVIVEVGGKMMGIGVGTPLRLPDEIRKKIADALIPATEEDVKKCLREFVDNAVSNPFLNFSDEEMEYAEKYLTQHKEIKNKLKKQEEKINSIYKSKDMRPHEQIKAMSEACEQYKDLLNQIVNLAKIDKLKSAKYTKNKSKKMRK